MSDCAISPFSRRARSRFAFRRERLVWAGWDEAKVVQPDEVMSCCAPAGLRVGGGSARKQCPPGQNRDPQHPPFLTSHRCRSRAWTRAFFVQATHRSAGVMRPPPENSCDLPDFQGGQPVVFVRNVRAKPNPLEDRTTTEEIVMSTSDVACLGRCTLSDYETSPPLQNSCDLPVFKASEVTLRVSARKDGKLRLVWAGWDDAKVPMRRPPSTNRLAPERRGITEGAVTRNECSKMRAKNARRFAGAATVAGKNP
jgi:hypothetical protein